MSAQIEAVEAGNLTAPTTATNPNAGTKTVQMWCLFVRVFHWSVVALFIITFATGHEIERLHIAAGYMIAGLVAARIVWGFVGPRHARFSDFVRPPAETVNYMRQVFKGMRRAISATTPQVDS
jgi:cytochrome b